MNAEYAGILFNVMEYDTFYGCWLTKSTGYFRIVNFTFDSRAICVYTDGNKNAMSNSCGVEC